MVYGLTTFTIAQLVIFRKVFYKLFFFSGVQVGYWSMDYFSREPVLESGNGDSMAPIAGTQLWNQAQLSWQHILSGHLSIAFF